MVHFGWYIDTYISLHILFKFLLTLGFFLANPNKTQKELLAVIGQSVQFSHFRLFLEFKWILQLFQKGVRTILLK